MAVLARKRPNYYLRENTGREPVAGKDAELIASIISACLAVVLFAFALWLMTAEPFGQTPSTATKQQSGLSAVGNNYAPLENVPSTGSTPYIVDESYRKTVR